VSHATSVRAGSDGPQEFSPSPGPLFIGGYAVAVLAKLSRLQPNSRCLSASAAGKSFIFIGDPGNDPLARNEGRSHERRWRRLLRGRRGVE
jgi:hypothetical protein